MFALLVRLTTVFKHVSELYTIRMRSPYSVTCEYPTPNTSLNSIQKSEILPPWS